MPALSVIVAVRDGEPYLADALTSLTRDPHPDLEVIVVDDGSVDATSAVAEDFRADLPGFRLLRNAVPAGAGGARNAGLALASGRYVTFLDGDDWVAPGYLAEMVASIDALGCDFVRVDHVQVEGRKRELLRAPESRRDTVLDPRDAILPFDARTMVDYAYAWAGIYRRDLGPLLAFPDGLRTAEDRPWIWRLHRKARSFAVVSLAGVFYRRGVPGSLTAVGDERQLDFFTAYETILDEVEPGFLLKAARNLTGLLAHHVELIDRFTPELRARFEERAAAVLRRVPAEALAGMDPDRRALVESLGLP
ncbi:glycosyltransferase family 2 protein [Microtetraspora sp. AC03309]|uniref:glycosyltransferase family 2 protein n=1 Tax=Microtetraspora sp. AC03309 TaxID=2779376 RepID=UPI001E5F33CA|nr:glycosyltransferase family 2 protein [Microtetraspora sp. AC03309]MCC5581649.1 glycosyltransferase family 2 protein [Microtetraspora sp. AC03309]